MANFNFEIKRQSYNIALRQTQDALCAGDTENGKTYLNRAAELCAQLIQNCTVTQIKEGYSREYKKLLTLQASLEKGENPFVRQQKVNSSAAQRPPVNCGVEPVNSETKPHNSAPANTEKYEYFSAEAPSTTLADVAGLDDVKKEIRLRVIAPMRDPELYRKYMDDAGCQILMYGPPGCGKSYVAEAIAGELGCAYAILNATELLDKYVGEGCKKLNKIFAEAQDFDNCLIFFDELDSVFSSREDEDSRHTKDILTTFLTCLSGFRSDDKGGIKVIIGATNRPWALDSALVRGKRFDTHIYVGLPDAEARSFLVHKAFKKNPQLLEDSDITEQELCDMFDGYSCADISSMLVKMKTRAFERALVQKETDRETNVPVTKSDAEAVIASYRNSVTKESLEAFKAFAKGEI